MEHTRSVDIPETLYEAIEERIKNEDFSSVSDFVIYAVRRVLADLGEHQESLSEEEKEKIQERLKALGYL